MKIERRSTDEERVIVTGMVMNTIVCARIAAKWPKPDQEPLFANKWAQLVGSWCVRHFHNFQVAPGTALQTIYTAWATSKQRDKDVVTMVDRFLQVLNDEREAQSTDLSSDYVMDLAAKYFNRVRLKRLAEGILSDLEIGDEEAAFKRHQTCQPLNIGDDQGIDIMEPEAIRGGFEEQGKPIIEFPGDRGEFFGNILSRDGFVCFVGPEKRGKSYQLIDLGWNAMLQRKRVAFFEVGDMSRNQIMRRLVVRAAGRPIRAGKIAVPTSIDVEDGKVAIGLDKRSYADELNWRDAYQAFQEVRKRRIKSQESYFKLFVYPNGTCSVVTIQGVLQSLARSNWTADAIIIDYADILAPMPGTERIDYRHQTNATWQALRALSQSQHCLVATATQASAASYNVHTIGPQHFSDDKRKWAHVTAAVGINSMGDEKKNGIIRLGMIMQREGVVDPHKQLYCASCLPMSNPCVRSCFG